MAIGQETPSRLQISLPDWQEWLASKADAAAATPDDYELHLGAVEWSLAEPLAINERDDFQSLPGIQVEPFDHQVSNAILFFRRLMPRGLIADDVGLGKTITAGLIAKELMDRGFVESLLVVCPKPLLEQWHDELASKFGIEAEPACGSDFTALDRKPHWITTYHTARARMDEIAQRRFDLLILDEAHALRNLHGTQQPPQVALAFERLMKGEGVRYAIALTATPIQNRLWDIFSQLEILRAPQPNPLGSPRQFENRFIQDKQTARQLKAGTEQEFRQLVGESTIRTRRGDTQLLFPDRAVKDAPLQPKPDEARFIEKALQTILKFPKLTQYVYARSLMSSPWALATSFENKARESEGAFRSELEQIAREARGIRSSAKTDAVLEMVRKSAREGRSERIIVFTMRVETLSHLETVLGEAGFGDQVAVMRGGQARSNQEAIEAFMADPPVRPILLSTDTGAVGLNLQAGNIVVNYDLPWNPMIIEQRIGRVQRLGQKAAHVIVHNLVLKGTIEDHVVRRLMEKLNLFDQAIGEMEELLELCGYDDEENQNRSLDQIIMDLVRKAAERKDIDKDLQKMEASRRAAEAKIREMREATDGALASIKPPDLGLRLEGLERVVPRVSLRDLIVRAVRHQGDEPIEEPDGRLFSRRGNARIELLLEPGSKPQPNAQPPQLLVSPGTRGFDRLVEPARDGIAHRIVDAQGSPLDEVESQLRDRLAPLQLVLESLQEHRRTQHSSVEVACRVGAQVAADRYETLIETRVLDQEDGIGEFISGVRSLDPKGHPLEPARGRDVRSLKEDLARLEGEITERVQAHPSIQKFAEFYRARYDEDVQRLARHIAGARGLQPDDDAEAVVLQEAKRSRAIRTALQSIQNRFAPRVRIEPVGASGVLYERAEVEARVRNRAQKRAHAIRLEVVPVSGAIRSELPLTQRALRDGDAWACPGGHLCHAEEFRSCADPGCGDGLCEECAAAGEHQTRLQPCGECDRVFCAEHRVPCVECRKLLCRDHAVPLSGRSGFTCPGCSRELESGVRVPASETARSVVSGRLGLRSQMAKSPLSGDYFFAAEGERCQETGELMPPSDLGSSAVTRRRIRRDYLEQDDVTGEQVERETLIPSAVSGRRSLRQRMQPSPKTGRMALPDEYSRCPVCRIAVPADELATCPETGHRLCAEHMLLCEESGERVAPEALGTCDATGRRVRRSLLGRDDVSGQTVLSRLLVVCERTGRRVLAERLSVSAVSGRRVLASELVPCEESGRLALPEELAACAVTGRLVHPDLLFECPETGVRMLRSAAVRCEATGAEVAPAALELCEATGKRVRRSLLGTDEVTGRRIQACLLRVCVLTGKKTTADQFARSARTGRLVLRDLLVPCAESGELALPDELERCPITGKLVMPRFLDLCGATQQRVLRSLLVPCEVTGMHVLPEHIGRCSQTGKMVVRSRLATSELTGAAGLSELLAVCEFTGAKGFAGELSTSGISGKRLRSDRAGQCATCERTGDASELQRCSLCQQDACKRDIAGGMCRSCAELLTRTTTREATEGELNALKAQRRWIRRAELVERGSFQWILARPGSLALWRHPEMIVSQRAASGESTVRIEKIATVIVLASRREAKLTMRALRKR